MKLILKIVLTLLSVIGIAMSAVTFYLQSLYRSGATAISIIGGSDGPTSIFLAGKINGPSVSVYIVTACLILATVVVFVKTGKKK